MIRLLAQRKLSKNEINLGRQSLPANRYLNPPLDQVVNFHLAQLLTRTSRRASRTLPTQCREDFDREQPQRKEIDTIAKDAACRRTPHAKTLR
jgi:hypothetical protein